MATSSHIELSPQFRPELAVSNITDDAAKKASELLQENHDKYHIFFNNDGFHNHIAHHLLTVYALGADPKTLQRRYEDNANYQLPAKKVDNTIIEKLHDPAVFKKNLGGTGTCYAKFLPFFQGEINEKGWEQVLNEYVFARDERAEDMLVRLYSGFLHPIIQLGFGIEFGQPAIIAEALAETAAHDNWIAPLFRESEKKANEFKAAGKESKSLMQLLEDVYADKELTESTTWPDANKIRDGILKRAPDRMIHHASQFFIRDESELEKRTAEMIHFCAYFATAAQHKPKHVKYDFFYMHSVNSSIFYTRFLKLPHFSTETKIRLLEWKSRGDLALYASRHSPKLSLDEITNYKPQKPAPDGQDPWPAIFERVTQVADDGHASKLVRALGHAKQVCVPFENDKDLGFKIRGGMWDTVGHMAIDSVEIDGPNWVRGAGWDEAWKDIPDRKAKL